MYNNKIDLITIDELCEILMVGKNTAYSLLKSGAIKSFKINRVWKIPRISVDEYIKNQVI
ncbi:helix-turn-helix domain-containing protein [Megamonas hypermegale]|uniref:helix-turn-helix domain-containing protein n=1 Tax=Megamonas hypermegale TaxID=158847 RepID=UPI0026ECC7B1|nr:helix-turn-helix domain-containing protein [Megamonas hypermegale]